MKLKSLISFYALLLFCVSVFSWGFVDANFFHTVPWLYTLSYSRRDISTALYTGLVVGLFFCYARFLQLVQKNQITPGQVWKLIAITVGILFFSYPGFSNDIFNYIATAKVTYFYGENPYIVMPIEIPNEPMLGYLHASNKVALYGPWWIALTFMPHVLSLGNVLVGIYTFKLWILSFYLGLCWFIWKLSGKRTWSLLFFGLNPLVVMETIVSIHNDVVMMFFALFAFYLLQRKNIWLSVVMITCSILIKYATAFLLPIYALALYWSLNNKKLHWQKVWLWSAIVMYVIFMLSPLREELYAWYLIWPLTFVALSEEVAILTYLSWGFSFGLLFRVAPFIYFREWGGITPRIKKIVTFIPPGALSLLYVRRKKA